MHIQTLNISVQTLSWLGDKIVDWSRAGESYSLTGEKRQLGRYHFGYKFDGSIHTRNGQYVFLFERLGTKGLLIKNGEILREINRPYYQADVYEFPAVFIDFNDRTYLVHCPTNYGQIDFEDVETGELVTNTKARNPPDIFHSRLEVSKNGKYLMSKGWVWHPVDVINIFEIKNCFEDPATLDKINDNSPDVGSEICTASFISDSSVLIGSSDEVLDDENLLRFPDTSLGIWNSKDNLISKHVKPGFEFGNLFAIDETLCWDTYKYPKLIDITSGEMVDKAESVFTGEQKSSILLNNEDQPQIAFDGEKKRLAVKDKDSVIIVTRE